jgi:hypothetical protein
MTEQSAAWGVWCQVWGGVTGRRAAWLTEGGAVARFDEARARERAAYLQRTMGGAGSGVTFSYVAKRFDEGATT